MIPQFPEFKKLELSDRDEIEAVTKDFPPYSDFNFTSLWSWDISGNFEVARYSDNLVVQFTDYISKEKFYSIFGVNLDSKIISDVLNFSSQRTGVRLLKLVPEHFVNENHRSNFSVQEDPDNFDYIFDLKQISTYSGSKFSSRRNLVNRFLKDCVPETKLIDIKKSGAEQSLLEVFKKWEKNKNSFHENEMKALKRFFQIQDFTKYLILGLYVHNDLVGFSITELIDENYSMGHFLKADVSVSNGIFAFLMQQTALHLLARGITLYNAEQDLGVETLRQWKKHYKPVAFFKKHVFF